MRVFGGEGHSVIESSPLFIPVISKAIERELKFPP